MHPLQAQRHLEKLWREVKSAKEQVVDHADRLDVLETELMRRTAALDEQADAIERQATALRRNQTEIASRMTVAGQIIAGEIDEI